jgi:hypothetical protein
MMVNAVVSKQPSEQYYLCHTTFPFPPDRFLLHQAVVYTADFWLLSNYCVAILFLKLIMVISADRCLHAT